MKRVISGSVSDLSLEQRDHRAPRAEHIAETGRGEDGAAIATVRIGCGDQPLPHQLGGAHHVGGVHRLVGRGEDDALDAVGQGGIDDILRAENVGLHRVARRLFTQDDVLERGSVQDHITPRRFALKFVRIADITKEKFDVAVAAVFFSKKK